MDLDIWADFQICISVHLNLIYVLLSKRTFPPPPQKICTLIPSTATVLPQLKLNILFAEPNVMNFSFLPRN